MKKICEVVFNSSGEPVNIVFSKGVSKKRRKKTLKRAWKRYRQGLADHGCFQSYINGRLHRMAGVEL